MNSRIRQQFTHQMDVTLVIRVVYYDKEERPKFKSCKVYTVLFEKLRLYMA